MAQTLMSTDASSQWRLDSDWLILSGSFWFAFKRPGENKTSEHAKFGCEQSDTFCERSEENWKQWHLNSEIRIKWRWAFSNGGARSR